MHAKQMPSSAQCSHSVIIFTSSISEFCTQAVAFGYFLVSDWKNARRRVQGGNYTLCLQMCVAAPFCSISKMAHAVHSALIYEANISEYSASVSSPISCSGT